MRVKKRRTCPSWIAQVHSLYLDLNKTLMHAQKVIGQRNRNMGYKIGTKLLQVLQDVNKSATEAWNKD